MVDKAQEMAEDLKKIYMLMRRETKDDLIGERAKGIRNVA